MTKDRKARLTLKSLAERVGRAEDRALAAEREISALRERARRLELLVGSGVVMMLNDLARHSGFRGEGITVDRQVDYQEYADSYLGQVHRIAGLETYDVIYEAPDGTRWENGVAVSKEYRKP